MHDARVVRGRERGEDLEAELAGAVDSERTEREVVGEGAAGQPLHHEERHAVVFAAVVDRHDVGMRGGAAAPCLGLEASPRARLLGEIGPGLDRHPPVEPAIRGVVHRAHAAAPDHAAEL